MRSFDQLFHLRSRAFRSITSRTITIPISISNSVEYGGTWGEWATGPWPSSIVPCRLAYILPVCDGLTPQTWRWIIMFCTDTFIYQMILCLNTFNQNCSTFCNMIILSPSLTLAHFSYSSICAFVPLSFLLTFCPIWQMGKIESCGSMWHTCWLGKQFLHVHNIHNRARLTLLWCHWQVVWLICWLWHGMVVW